MVLKNLAFFRRKAGLSQQELATILGVPRFAITRLEASVGSTRLLLVVMETLNIRMANIGDGDDIPHQLRRRRSRRGWTIAETSVRANIAPRTVVAVERGEGTVASLLSLLAVLAPNAKLHEPLRDAPRRRKVISIHARTRQASDIANGSYPTGSDVSTSVEIFHADCIEIMKTMPKGTVDLIIADPPYKLEMPARSGVDDLLDHKGMRLVNEGWDKFTLDEYLDFTERWLDAAIALLKPTGSIAIFGSYHNIGLINFVLQRRKLMIINDIAWFKRNAVPHLAGRRLTASFETILWAAPSKGYRFNYDAMKDHADDLIHTRGNQMRNVWDIPTAGDESVDHPTQKPVAVYKRLIEMTTRRGDVVLDPFAGSGTLGVAAKRIARNAIMIEKDFTYVHIIERRMTDEIAGRAGPS